MFFFVQFGCKGKTFYENRQAFCLFFAPIAMYMYFCCINMKVAGRARGFCWANKNATCRDDRHDTLRWVSRHVTLAIATRCVFNVTSRESFCRSGCRCP